MEDSLCSFNLPVVPFVLKRVFSSSNVQTVFLEESLKLFDDDTVDDVIGKIALHYKLESIGFYIFSLKEPLIYRVADFPFDVNPFVATSEYTGITTQFNDHEILHSKCLIDFEIPNNELYVVYIDDLLDYAKNDELINENLQSYSKNVLRFYFKESLVDNLFSDWKNSDNELFKDKVRVRYSLQNTTVNNEIKFKNCSLLEAQI